jgi:mitogen-activated protein kinase kinase kinase
MFHIGVATKHPPLPEPGQLSKFGIEFIESCLIIDPMLRPTANELLNHHWILQFREDMAEYEEHLSDIPTTPGLTATSLPSFDPSESVMHRRQGIQEQLEQMTIDVLTPPDISPGDQKSPEAL